jgi:hypothetical protein
MRRKRPLIKNFKGKRKIFVMKIMLSSKVQMIMIQLRLNEEMIKSLFFTILIMKTS